MAIVREMIELPFHAAFHNCWSSKMCNSIHSPRLRKKLIVLVITKETAALFSIINGPKTMIDIEGQPQEIQ
jgi:hypothetical protein